MQRLVFLLAITLWGTACFKSAVPSGFNPTVGVITQSVKVDGKTKKLECGVEAIIENPKATAADLHVQRLNSNSLALVGLIKNHTDEAFMVQVNMPEDVQLQKISKKEDALTIEFNEEKHSVNFSGQGVVENQVELLVSSPSLDDCLK